MRIFDRRLHARRRARAAAGFSAYSFLKQAAWQMTQHIEQIFEQKHLYAGSSVATNVYRHHTCQRRVSVWVGKGNNGGDGWL
ncbi:MAG: NAD(P)H-hydrate dehydratase, partial [Alphaproteobacteria bacterium]